MSGDVGKVGLALATGGVSLLFTNKKKKDKDKAPAPAASVDTVAQQTDPYNLNSKRAAVAPRRSFLASEQGVADGKSTVLGG